MSAQRTGNLPPHRYAPDTILNIGPITFPAAYSLVGKEIVFETEKNGVVNFRFSSEDGSDITIVDQQGFIALNPNTVSVGLDDNIRFLDAIGELPEIEYRYDFRVIAETVSDYRFQGILNILESHGPYKAKT